MASAAMLRSAARSLRLRKTLEPERCGLLARRFLSSSTSSSSVPTEKSQPYSDNIYERLLMKADKIQEGVDEHSRLIKELEAVLKENNKNAGANLTPWVVSISSSLLCFGLYKYFS